MQQPRPRIKVIFNPKVMNTPDNIYKVAQTIAKTKGLTDPSRLIRFLEKVDAYRIGDILTNCGGTSTDRTDKKRQCFIRLAQMVDAELDSLEETDRSRQINTTSIMPLQKTIAASKQVFITQNPSIDLQIKLKDIVTRYKLTRNNTITIYTSFTLFLTDINIDNNTTKQLSLKNIRTNEYWMTLVIFMLELIEQYQISLSLANNNSH